MTLFYICHLFQSPEEAFAIYSCLSNQLSLILSLLFSACGLSRHTTERSVNSRDRRQSQCVWCVTPGLISFSTALISSEQIQMNMEMTHKRAWLLFFPVRSPFIPRTHNLANPQYKCEFNYRPRSPKGNL